MHKSSGKGNPSSSLQASAQFQSRRAEVRLLAELAGYQMHYESYASFASQPESETGSFCLPNLINTIVSLRAAIFDDLFDNQSLNRINASDMPAVVSATRSEPSAPCAGLISELSWVQSRGPQAFRGGRTGARQPSGPSSWFSCSQAAS